MANLDSILNAVIPWAIAIIGIYLLYRPLKEPLNPLFAGIGNTIRGIKRIITGEGRGEELIEEVEVIEYE